MYMYIYIYEPLCVDTYAHTGVCIYIYMYACICTQVVFVYAFCKHLKVTSAISSQTRSDLAKQSAGVVDHKILRDPIYTILP